MRIIILMTFIINMAIAEDMNTDAVFQSTLSYLTSDQDIAEKKPKKAKKQRENKKEDFAFKDLESEYFDQISTKMSAPKRKRIRAKE